ncbi:hypothetical protein EC968_006699 [Mortierella alpina]|nr:hypothetical protein EC968_006699 [Mortierella alpina]
MSGRHHHEPSRHNLEVSNQAHHYHANAHAHPAPHRPHRSKRAIPDPAGAPALGSSLSQLSLQDDLASSIHSSLPSSPSTVSLASSLVDIRQLDSGVDLQEAPKPVNRRSNRGFRIIQPTEMDEFNLQESIRHSKTAQKPLPPHPTAFLNQDQDDNDDGKDDDDDEESYFGDILDKYCDSDEDPPSPTMPASKVPSWKNLQAAQPPTPPVSRSRNAQQTNTASRRAPDTSAPSFTPTARRDNHSSSSSDALSRREPGSDRTGTRSRENSVTSSPINPASAKFNMYLHAGAAQESRDSLAKSSSTASSSSASSTARAYTKRPPPPPKDQAPTSLYVSTNSSAPAFQPRTSSSSGSSVVSPSQPSGSDNISRNHISGHYRGIEPSHHAKESRPDPPPKDTSRRPHHSHSSSTNTSSSNGRTSSSSQPPVLSLDTQTSDSFGSFADVVDASMNRHRASPSVSSTASGHSYHQDSHAVSQGSSRARSNSNQNQPGMRSSDRYEQTAQGHRSESGYGRTQGQGHSSEQSRHGQSHKHPEQQEHHHQHHHSHSSQGHHSNQTQSHSRSHSQSQNQNQSSQQYHQPYKTSQSTSYRMHGSTSQLDLTGSGYSAKASSTPPAPTRGSSQQQQPPLLGERSRSYSQGAVSTPSSSVQNGYPGSSRGLKSTLVKTPIARARAKEARGPRKVLFGDMITIVSIERAETPPPPPVLDKKARKKLLQAKKNAAAKEGKGGPIQNFDPEYDAAYYNAPFTPTPAEVVVTLAPWIGNPNYDEEKANSKFYYDDEYDYDDEDEYEYDTAYESDIRLGPEDDDEDEDDEDDEDDEEYASRSWGHGIAGPGGSLPKKKGGMFKFKRAVNKLFLN